MGRTIPIGDFNVTRHLVRYRTDQSKKASLQGSYEFGGYFNGDLATWKLSGRLAPIPHFALTADYEHNNFGDFGTENESFETDLYSIGLRVAANSRIQLSTFYQYNTFDNRGRINVRGSWEFSPLSFLYIVFNENNIQENPTRNRSFVSKLSYMRQF